MLISLNELLIVQVKLFDNQDKIDDVEVTIPDILKVHRNYYELVGFI